MLDPGDDIIPSISAACERANIEQGVIVTFSGAFRSVELIASHTPAADPELPLADSVVVAYTEGIGSGTITSRDGEYAVHLHVVAGEKDAAAAAYAGHLLRGTAHYTVEVVIDEVLLPRLERSPRAGTYGIPTLGFEQTND